MRTVKQKGSWFLSPLPLIFLSLFASHCGLADRETAKKPRVTLQPTSVSSGEGIQTYKVSGDPMVVTWTVSPGYQADYTLQSCPGTGEDEVTGCIDVLSFLCLGRTVCSVVESSQGTELAQMSISQDVHLGGVLNLVEIAA
jgi:hypothetical protein